MDSLTWAEFQNYLDFKQGEHATLIGPTGRGKTTLALAGLIPQQPFVVVMAAKPRDPLISDLRKQGYLITEEWPPPEPRTLFNRVVFWPRIESMEDLEKQKDAFRNALTEIYRSKGWCVYLDEARYITQFLQLERITETLWLQGRSLGISLVCGTQRPRWIPLSAYDQATHLFFWKDSDEQNIKRLCEMAPVSATELRTVMEGLDRHQFVYINTRSDLWLVSQVELEEVAA